MIRDIKNWGVFRLPRPISRHQVKHSKGHYFVLRYDVSGQTHAMLRETLRLDPRMVRLAGVKLGDGKLETLSKFGDIPWKSFE